VPLDPWLVAAALNALPAMLCAGILVTRRTKIDNSRARRLQQHVAGMFDRNERLCRKLTVAPPRDEPAFHAFQIATYRSIRGRKSALHGRYVGS